MTLLPEPQATILIRCPQCGGEIDFLEEAQVIRCGYCGSSLLVAGREGVLRYVLPAQVSDAYAARNRAFKHLLSQGKHPLQVLETFLFHAPFWRLQGTVYRWVFGLKPLDGKFEINPGVPPPMERGKELLTRVLDYSVAGYRGLELGFSTLGIRTQVLRLRPFGREDLERRESFLPLDIPLKQAQAEAERYGQVFFAKEDLVPEVILHRLVRRIFSVIFLPLWYVECLHEGGRTALLIDGVSQSVTASAPDRSAIQARLRGDETRKPFDFSEIRFLPFRCPNCGWAFPFRPFSLLHFCPRCRRLWREERGEWGELAYEVSSPPQIRSLDRVLWVPFWRCRVAIESAVARIATMAELYRLAHPLRVVDEQKEALRPIYFYIPALKFQNPQIAHTLASRLSFLQPEFIFGPFPDGSHPATAGVSLHAKDAMELGTVILGSLIPPNNRQALAWLKDCTVELTDPQIFYFPFTRADLFYREISTGLAFQRNALAEDPCQGE